MTGLYDGTSVTFFAKKKDQEGYYMVADHFTPEETAAAAAVLLKIEGSGRRFMISDDPDLKVPAGVEFRNIVDWMLEDSGPEADDSSRETEQS